MRLIHQIFVASTSQISECFYVALAAKGEAGRMCCAVVQGTGLRNCCYYIIVRLLPDVSLPELVCSAGTKAEAASARSGSVGPEMGTQCDWVHCQVSVSYALDCFSWFFFSLTIRIYSESLKMFVGMWGRRSWPPSGCAGILAYHLIDVDRFRTADVNECQNWDVSVWWVSRCSKWRPVTAWLVQILEKKRTLAFFLMPEEIQIVCFRWL